MTTEHDHLAAARLDGAGFVVLGAGGGGMGTATSQALKAAGAELLCVDANQAEAEAIAGEVGGTPLAADITERAEVEAVFAKAQERFGARFRGVVDIVGIARNGAIPSFDDGAVERQFDLVFRHALLAIQIGGPILAAGGGGAMTFIGSISGDAVVPNQTIYGTAKAALHHLIRCAANEFGPQGVRVNGIAPGFVRTPRLRTALPQAVWDEIAAGNPLRRAAEPNDIAKAALFLSSDLAAYVNGQILALDGGSTNVVTFPGLDIPLAGAAPKAA